MFVSQEVKVKLGEHGGELTLMTTEAGGYTRNGQAFQSGATVEAERQRVQADACRRDMDRRIPAAGTSGGSARNEW